MANEQQLAIYLTSTDVFQIVLALVGAIYFLLKLLVGQERQRIDQTIKALEERMETKVLNHQQLMDEKFTRLLENMTLVSKGLAECTDQMHYLNNQLGIFNTKMEFLKPQPKE